MITSFTHFQIYHHLLVSKSEGEKREEDVNLRLKIISDRGTWLEVGEPIPSDIPSIWSLDFFISVHQSSIPTGFKTSSPQGA